MKQTISDHVKAKGIRFTVKGKEYALRAPMWWEQDAAEEAQAKKERWMRMTDPEIQDLVDLEAPAEEKRFITLLAEFENKMRKASTDPLTQEQSLRRANAIESKLATRTAADRLLDGFGVQARNRYLAWALLVNPKNSEPLVFDDQSIAVQNRATEIAEEIWSSLDEIPFLCEPEQS